MNNEPLTFGVANKGFSGLQSVVVRFKFYYNLIGKKPEIPYYPYRQPLAVI